MNPFAWTGFQFLATYVVGGMVVAVWMIAVRVVTTRGRTTEPPEIGTLDAAELAYLGGGWPRAVEAAVAGLHHRGLVEVFGGTIRLAETEEARRAARGWYRGMAGEPPLSAVERHVLSNLPNDIPTLTQTGTPAEADLHAQVASRGLVVTDPAAARRLMRAPAFALAAFGGVQILLKVGSHPVLFLVGLVGLTLWPAFACSMPRTTSLGDQALAAAKVHHAALELTATTASHQVTPPQLALAYALFGAAVITPALAELMPSVQAQAASVASSSCGTGSSCGSSDGGSGGGSSCGGGCGGCGGCS